MKISPLILGAGRSGHAIAKSLASLAISQPELGIQMPVWLKRGQNLAQAKENLINPVLCVSNPHGLHAQAITDADQAGYSAILCEKPSCVRLEDAHALRKIKTPTAVFHVYRQTWGIQTLKSLIETGELGQVVCIEGRYWQSSTAEKSLTPETSKKKTWKDEPKLSGNFDTYLDLGTHWVDAASTLIGALPEKLQGWRSYANAESSHRDSHIHLNISYPNGIRGLASISKNVHGATNQFEIHVVGTQKSASWKFLEADEILIGQGRDRTILTRKSNEYGSGQSPFHGMGWAEGYIEISRQLLNEVFLKKAGNFPRLSENTALIEAMLKISWTGEPRE